MSLFRNSENRSTGNWDVLRGLDFGHGGSPFRANNVESALRLAPVYAATSLIADTFSMFPASGYTFDRSGNRVKLKPQPELCWNPHPIPWLTHVEWKHQFATSFLLRGNAYGYITALDDFGRPSKIAWLNPDGIRVDETGSLPVYYFNEEEIPRDTLVHIPWYPKPGSVVGLSPISLFKTVIEAGGSAVDFGHNWFKSGSMPSGHLKYGLGPLDPQQSQTVKARFKAAVAGNDIFVSGSDWDWKALSVTANEAQFLQSIKATATQVATIFRVNPEDIGGEGGNSLTYKTLELDQIRFQIRTVQPMTTRLEAHLTRLLPDFQYVKFNLDAMIRTDLKNRMEAYAIQLREAIRTNPEVRALEDLAPLTDEEIEIWKAMYQKAAPAPAAPAENEGDDPDAGS